MTTLDDNEAVKNNPEGSVHARNLLKKVQLRMRQNPKPIKAWEKTGRGIVDPTSVMVTMIKPNYPDNI